MEDCPFASALHVSLEPGAETELSVGQTRTEFVRVRFVTWVSGGSPRALAVEVQGASLTEVGYAGVETGIFGYIVEDFGDGEAVCAVRNSGDAAMEVVAYDIFGDGGEGD